MKCSKCNSEEVEPIGMDSKPSTTYHCKKCDEVWKEESTLKCSQCGTPMYQAPVALMSNPVKYRYHCPKCNNTITSYTPGLGNMIRSPQHWQQLQKEFEDVKPKDKIQRHKELCDFINDLYARKNADYGDSFHISYKQEGMAMPRIRLGDKYNRFCALTRGKERKVTDESLRDTLIDLANYALMTVLELDEEAGQT